MKNRSTGEDPRLSRGVYVTPYHIFGHMAITAVDANRDQVLLMPLLDPDDEDVLREVAWRTLEAIEASRRRLRAMR